MDAFDGDGNAFDRQCLCECMEKVGNRTWQAKLVQDQILDNSVISVISPHKDKGNLQHPHHGRCRQPLRKSLEVFDTEDLECKQRRSENCLPEEVYEP